MPRIASFSNAALYDVHQCRSSFVASILRQAYIQVGGKGRIACFVFGAYFNLFPLIPTGTTRTWINHHNLTLSVQAKRHPLIRQDQQRYGREASAARSRRLAKSAGD